MVPAIRFGSAHSAHAASSAGLGQKQQAQAPSDPDVDPLLETPSAPAGIELLNPRQRFWANSTSTRSRLVRLIGATTTRASETHHACELIVNCA
eukprot:CAMPEP_0204562814 /NCGR_PEP_ID=MMETSP0661-20131031/33956_1 /ASSEMBLY_ACC=CAM_ASM_000606 /TAXON_ID=109239 /ORGANISM="Alexandrium margalefi, Strain AMGDE01CS-322" /LENGTH=93 /DNA_ID=CAMNT_0051570317 /DNA_START=14 /DNA_END=293 /DNA_ORIENTATION=+